jgi:hypothetical protein
VLPVLEKYRAIIRDYKISVFEEAGSSFRLRAIVFLIDGSLATADCSCAGTMRRIGMSRRSLITSTLESREM